MGNSYFSHIEKTPCAFSDLPRPAQKAFIWRAAENGGELSENIHVNIGSCNHAPCDVTEEAWGDAISKASVSCEGMFFYFFEVPTESIKSIILTNNECLSEDYSCWEDYESDYVDPTLVMHSRTDRFPVLAPLGEEEVLEDGWHRLHSYISQGHSSVPVLEF
jgi:hypothetical protein